MIRMKSTRTFMFLICPIMVLIFLYYSSGRLHLRSPVQKSQAVLDRLIFVGRVVASEYDKQGFVTKLDRKLPLELQYKYGNLSKGECKPGYAGAKMTSIFPKFSKPAPMFLDLNFRRLSKINNYMPPFGIRTQEKIIDLILQTTKKYSLGSYLDNKSCKTCIIIGNGGILFNKSLGSQIDQYDVVVRLNEAPVAGFEKDVGTKTTMRITYPEGAIQKTTSYEKSSLFVLSAFKSMDFKWLSQMVSTEKLEKPLNIKPLKLRSMEGFWKSVAREVPRKPKDMRILNPYFIQEAAFRFIGLPHNNGLMGRGHAGGVSGAGLAWRVSLCGDKTFTSRLVSPASVDQNIPTLGTVAITMALHNCDEVAVAGFGYNMNTPHATLHYYEKLMMSAIKESWTHNITKEKEFLRKLVKGGVIQDLTNGI